MILLDRSRIWIRQVYSNWRTYRDFLELKKFIIRISTSLHTLENSPKGQVHCEHMIIRPIKDVSIFGSSYDLINSTTHNPCLLLPHTRYLPNNLSIKNAFAKFQINNRVDLILCFIQYFRHYFDKIKIYSIHYNYIPMSLIYLQVDRDLHVDAL